MTPPVRPDTVTRVVDHIEGDIAVIVIDNPPVNALSWHVRQGLFDGLAKAVEDGAKGVVVAATHAVFSDPAIDVLQSALIDQVVVTDTLPIPAEKRWDRLSVLPIAPLLARAIREVFEDGSVTSMFDGAA